MKDAHTREIKLQGHVEDGLYALHLDAVASPSSPSSPKVFSAIRTSAQLWHNQLGHPLARTTSLVLRKYHLPFSTDTNLSSISACHLAKAHSLPYPSSPSCSSFAFQLIFVDVWGPASALSSNGSRYFLSILDDYSKYMRLFPLQLKSSVSSIVMALLKYVETQFFTKVMSIQTDNGGEFRAANFLQLRHYTSFNLPLLSSSKWEYRVTSPSYCWDGVVSSCSCLGSSYLLGQGLSNYHLSNQSHAHPFA